MRTPEREQTINEMTEPELKHFITRIEVPEDQKEYAKDILRTVESISLNLYGVLNQDV